MSKRDYPNKKYCIDCYYYEFVKDECNETFGPAIITSGNGKEYCMTKDRLTNKEMIQMNRYIYDVV